ncbi:MAG: SprT family zinc-dependent metalloprotease [Chloroflexota bacterium]
MSILKGLQHVLFGTTAIEFELTFSERKTLAIHVFPDGSVVVDAPMETPLAEVEVKVLKRAAWILRQQRQFQSYAAPKVLPRRYVNGESYRYLGRQYRLKIVEYSLERVVLSRGYLTVSLHNTSDKEHIAQLVEKWYRQRAQFVFQERFVLCYPHVAFLGIPHPEFAIRDMKSRWGSCTATGRILLNLKLIQAPKNLIDYVIVHELCHLKEHNHSPTFYTILDRVLADWRERRQRLNQMELT